MVQHSMTKMIYGNICEDIFLHSMEKKSTFIPYHIKKHHSTLEMDTYKGMLLLSIINLWEIIEKNTLFWFCWKKGKKKKSIWKFFWKNLKNFPIFPKKNFKLIFFHKIKKGSFFSIISDVKHLKYMFWLKISSCMFPVNHFSHSMLCEPVCSEFIKFEFLKPQKYTW